MTQTSSCGRAKSSSSRYVDNFPRFADASGATLSDNFPRRFKSQTLAPEQVDDLHLASWALCRASPLIGQCRVGQCRVGEDLFSKYGVLPKMLPHVTRAEIYPAPGPVVSTTVGTSWIAYVFLGTRTSRAHSLALYRNMAEMRKKALNAHRYNCGYES